MAFSLPSRSQLRSVDGETPRKFAAALTVRYSRNPSLFLGAKLIKPYQTLQLLHTTFQVQSTSNDNFLYFVKRDSILARRS